MMAGNSRSEYAAELFTSVIIYSETVQVRNASLHWLAIEEFELKVRNCVSEAS